MFQNSLLVSSTHSSLTFRKLCCSSFTVGQVFIKFTTFTSLCSVLQGINDKALKNDVSSFSRNMLSGLKREDVIYNDARENFEFTCSCIMLILDDPWGRKLGRKEDIKMGYY